MPSPVGIKFLKNNNKGGKKKKRKRKIEDVMERMWEWLISYRKAIDEVVWV